MTIEDLVFGMKRRRSRHKRILNAERSFHQTLLDLKPGDITIDCGANVGLYTRFLARTGATVHAFEPDPVAFAELNRNTASLPNVVLHQAAVGVADGETDLFRSVRFDTDGITGTVDSSVMGRGRQLSKSGAIRVKVVSLPDFIVTLPGPVSVLKMDIEGAEVDILEALMAGEFSGKVTRAFVETHERTHSDLRARTFQLVRRAGKCHPNWNLDWA